MKLESSTRLAKSVMNSTLKFYPSLNSELAQLHKLLFCSSPSSFLLMLLQQLTAHNRGDEVVNSLSADFAVAYPPLK